MVDGCSLKNNISANISAYGLNLNTACFLSLQ